MKKIILLFIFLGSLNAMRFDVECTIDGKSIERRVEGEGPCFTFEENGLSLVIAVNNNYTSSLIRFDIKPGGDQDSVPLLLNKKCPRLASITYSTLDGENQVIDMLFAIKNYRK